MTVQSVHSSSVHCAHAPFTGMWQRCVPHHCLHPVRLLRWMKVLGEWMVYALICKAIVIACSAIANNFFFVEIRAEHRPCYGYGRYEYRSNG